MAAVAIDINSGSGNTAETPDVGKLDISSTKGNAVQHKDGSITETLSLNGRPEYPKSRVNLIDRFVDEPRKIRVVVIGGGLAGILAGCLLPEKVPGIELVIYEKNPDFGGTWYENVYPGVRCDIPSHVYQSTFSPKTDWSDEFAPGAEIRDYWQSVARKFNVYRFAKFNHRVEEANWDAVAGAWSLNITDLNTNAVVQEKADAVLTCVGRFNSWRLPNYPGMSEYKGVLRHASHWDPEFDPTGKRVAVIGNGASGIQLVANLQPIVSQLDHYARSKTWIAASWAGDERTLGPQPIPDEKKKAFEDPQVYLEFRKTMEDKYWRRFGTFLKGEANDDMRKFFTDTMRARLSKKPELLENLIPDFSPNCRRLTPGPGYLEALQEDNVDFVRQPIRRFTQTGIETVDGKHREVDAVFCATGANGDMVPPFTVQANGRDLASLWHPEGEHGYPYTYLGTATPGFPNLFFVHGPHSTGPSGTVPHSVEVQLTHYSKILRKISREGIKSMVPKKKAADDFVEYCDAFFSKTVLADGCSSWYNGGRPGGRVHGLWPGSSNHVTLIKREPRWEDWEYEYLDESQGNSLLWYFGNGGTRAEQDPAADMTSYLKLPQETNLKSIHESWWELP
ncbi:Putative sterigmatocystin biosynthesis monooxygenase stcW [Cytospora mali]|uniref:Sterigmatocystin biosynthesis monooxygenase stcW n=1 Tax=Cytospora mali TaxID=578113 RepID=A0A194UVY3_CYTMA|nr:Putative sterigmatocystin biosynthesis monooxygenase stcW [Valsa mali var. pyri (nom. inval.)]